MGLLYAIRSLKPLLLLGSAGFTFSVFQKSFQGPKLGNPKKLPGFSGGKAFLYRMSYLMCHSVLMCRIKHGVCDVEKAVASAFVEDLLLEAVLMRNYKDTNCHMCFSCPHAEVDASSPTMCWVPCSRHHVVSKFGTS